MGIDPGAHRRSPLGHHGRRQWRQHGRLNGAGLSGSPTLTRHRFRLFGLTIASDFPFRLALPSGYGRSELTLLRSHRREVEAFASPPVYVSAFQDRSGASLASLYRSPQEEVLHFPGAGDFHLRARQIEGYVPDPASGLAELRLLGPVFSYWFERRGLPTLHASAVALNGQAWAFVSRHGGGKTGLAAALVGAGAALVTDDLLVLENREDRWEARPSYPEMRMWP